MRRLSSVSQWPFSRTAATACREGDERRTPHVNLAILGQIAHRPDCEIDCAIDLTEAGASLAGFRIVDDGEKSKGRRRHAAFTVALAKCELHHFVVETVLDAQPLLPQSATGQTKCKDPERLGGFPDQIRRAGRKQRSGCQVWRRSKRDHAPGHHGDAQRARVTENAHLTPHVRASARRISQLATGSFRRR